MKKIFIIIFVGLLFFTPALLFSQETTLPENALTATNALTPAPPAVETATFQLKYVPLGNAADQVRELMGSAQGGVVVNEQAHQLEISAPLELMTKIKTLILNLDQQRDIVMEVKVVQIDLNEDHLPGINWAAIVSDYKGFTVKEDKRKFSAGTISKDDFTVLLEALDTVGDKKVFAAKSIKVGNGEDADLRLKAFDQNVTVTLEASNQTVLGAIPKQDRYTARFVVSPLASADNIVDLGIPTSEGNVMTLHVKGDSVAVIGGIFTQTKLQSTKKFPFLGDLPLVGVVFRDQSKVTHRLENIIFLTPHVSVSSADGVSH